MGHTHSNAVTGRRLGIALLLTLGFVAIEAVAGYVANSLALLSDAGHNFADAVALGLSWYGIWIARRPATSGRTFGYHRVGVLAALVNALTLVAIAGFIFFEAAERLRVPHEVASAPMIVVALIAIALNAFISAGLHGASSHDVNVRSAYLHMLGDAVSAAGVVVAGIVVAATGASIADPIESILIGLLVLWSSWSILNESVDILLESIPRGLDMRALERAIATAPGVLAVHDLHVWTVGSGIVAACCHIVVDEQSIREGQQVLKAVTHMMEHDYRIAHTTVQVEVEGCEANDMYCVMRAVEEHDHGHEH